MLKKQEVLNHLGKIYLDKHIVYCLRVYRMINDNTLDFGVITVQNAPWEKLVERWKFIEEAGFDSVWVADHFAHWIKKTMTFFEAWSTLSGLACETSRIRIGTLVSAIH